MIKMLGIDKGESEAEEKQLSVRSHSAMLSGVHVARRGPTLALQALVPIHRSAHLVIT